MKISYEDRVALFWSHVRREESGCWIYEGKSGVNGYATVNFLQTQMLAHRLAYQLQVGDIPEGMQIDHLCRVRRCVNPEHLEVVTQRENLIRGNGFAGLNARKTHCIRGHEFTPENTRLRPKGRACRACDRLHEANRTRRGKEVVP